MREIQKNKIIKEIAHEEQAPYMEARKAVESQFRFTREVMRSQREKGIRLPYFGRFFPDPVRVRRLLMIKWAQLKKLKEKVENSNKDTIPVKKQDLINLIDTGLYLYERNQQLKARKK